MGVRNRKCESEVRMKDKQFAMQIAILVFVSLNLILEIVRMFI